ncbi:MAG: NUDIX domain-containing protein [Verrucomicrobiales bacterium]
MKITEPRKRVSAGLLMYQIDGPSLKVLLAHPGGPFHVRKDSGHWTIPKGEPANGEDLLLAAQREFHEETGLHPKPPFIELGEIQQKGGKWVHAWGFSAEIPDGWVHTCNNFRLEWPPASGRFEEYPEIDKVCFFPIDEARRKMKGTQHPFLDRLAEALGF